MLKWGSILFLNLFFGLLAKSQNRVNFEISGGPTKNWMQTSNVVTSLNHKIEASNPVQFNFGFNSLFKISPLWQLTAETEFVKKPFNIVVYNQRPTGLTTSTSIKKISLTNLRLGLRYELNRERISYYVQPAIGIAISSNRNRMEADSTADRISLLKNINAVAFILKAEAGVKILEGKKSYALFGARQQFGLSRLDNRTFKTNTGAPSDPISITSSGSFTSLFLSIGFTGTKSRMETITPAHSERKSIRSELLGINGPYGYLQGGLRLRETGFQFPSVANFGFANLLLGQKVNNFYGEAGLGIVNINSIYQIDHDGHEAFILHREPSTIRYIPATLKYAIPISPREKSKLGFSVTANYIISGNYDNVASGSDTGSRTINGVTYPFTGNYQIEAGLRPRKTFFNTGFYLEREVLQVGFLNFKLSTNFGSDVHRRIRAEYNVDGVQYSVTSESRLNGFLAEFGFRLPFSVLSKRQKNLQKVLSEF
ncbi:MAG: hypothetical protein BroJett042_10310 [Bacteroidota bacterium]|nr:MAG: hypothetical protein BroJett042_10310 [Bacteroidota bacterium]